MGLWAIDTHNPNSFDACVSNTLLRSKADAVALQETRLKTDAEIVSAKARAKRSGWSAHLSQAKITAAGRGSGGCGVAVRKGAGIAPVDISEVDPRVRHRISAAWLDVVVKGGITIILVYLAGTEGISEHNLLVLREAAALARALRAPWIRAGDRDVTPNALAGTG